MSAIEKCKSPESEARGGDSVSTIADTTQVRHEIQECVGCIASGVSTTVEKDATDVGPGGCRFACLSVTCIRRCCAPSAPIFNLLRHDTYAFSTVNTDISLGVANDRLIV